MIIKMPNASVPRVLLEPKDLFNVRQRECAGGKGHCFLKACQKGFCTPFFKVLRIIPPTSREVSGRFDESLELFWHFDGFFDGGNRIYIILYRCQVIYITVLNRIRCCPQRCLSK